MADLLDFVPIYTRTTDDIRAALDSDANIGVDPSDPAFIDTTEGGIYFSLTQPLVLELARLWDFASTEVPATVFPEFAWGPYLDEWGVTVGLDRKAEVPAAGEITFTGTPGTLIAADVRVATPQTDPDVAPPEFKTTISGTIPGGGSITLPIVAAQAGSAGNVASGTITLLVSPISGGTIAAVSNANPTAGGAEEETDDAFRERILLELSSAAGGGNKADYVKWALEEPGVGFVTVIPLAGGPGTVSVIVTDPDNNPVPSGVVTSLQTRLDPVAGMGEGLAPIGAAVTVSTPTQVNAAVTGTVTYEAGYSKDGALGTVAIGDAIEEAIAAYVDHLGPGDDVILNHVEAQFFKVKGVFNIASVQINASATNLAISATQVANLTTVTLSP